MQENQNSGACRMNKEPMRELRASDCTWEERPGYVVDDKYISHFANASYNWKTGNQVFPVVKPEFEYLVRKD